jgi:predicted nuclease of predicted toxin-antitoxin system
MDIKLDENLPTVLVARLVALGHDVDTVPQEQLTGQSDPLVWNAAQQAQRFLITQDLDFSDVRQFQPGTHYGLMLVRLQTPSRRRLAERIESVFQDENVADWNRCFVVITDHKVRVRRP